MEESATYQLKRSHRVAMIAFNGLAPVAVIAVIVVSLHDDETEGLWFLALWSVGFVIQAHWMLFRMPWRIETNESGLRFLARTRTVDVPWEQLRSIASPWYDLSHQVTRWRWDGGKLRIWGPFEAQHRLLSTVEDKAPHAEVRA